MYVIIIANSLLDYNKKIIKKYYSSLVGVVYISIIHSIIIGYIIEEM